MKLSEAGELGLLRELESRGLIEGTEHDAAQLAGGLVVTQDALVEGVHFRLDLLAWRELGFRAAAVNISDLAASAARPEALLVTLALPGEIEVDDVVDALRGDRGGRRARSGRRYDPCRPGRRQRHRARPLGARAGASGRAAR